MYIYYVYGHIQIKYVGTLFSIKPVSGIFC
jgi:hypothetical protein